MAEAHVAAVTAAAEGGSASAKNSLALLLDTGACGVPQDRARAAALMAEAAAAGDMMATYNRAVTAHREGRAAEHFRLLTLAAEGGFCLAMHDLSAELVRKGGRDAEAVRWLLRAAEGGIFSSMVNLGNRCREGRSMPRDAAASVAWYRKAVATGEDTDGSIAHCAALLLLGDVGRAVGIVSQPGLVISSPDPAAAVELLRASAARDHAGSHFILAMFHMTGTVLPKSALWIPLMRRARALGAPQAVEFLARNNLELRDGDDERAYPARM